MAPRFYAWRGTFTNDEVNELPAEAFDTRLLDASENLFDLIVNDHDKTGHLAVDSGNGRAIDPVGGPGPKGLFGPRLDQFRWDEPAVAILPTETPDLGDLIGIRGSCFSNRHLRTGRDNETNLSS